MSSLKITERDIYDFKIYKSFKDYVPKVFFNIIKDLYYKHENSSEGTLPFLEFLKITGYKSKKLLPDDILNLTFNYSNDSNETYMDVSNCFSIILLLKDSKTKLFENKLADDIYKKVVELKNIRNDLVKRNCETKELHEFKDKLIAGINFICNSIPKLYPSSKDVVNKYNNLKEKFNSLIFQLWEEKLSKNEPTIIELLKNAKNDKFRHFVTQCREQIIDKYKKLNESSPLIQGRFQFNIDTMFIEPILKDKGDPVFYKNILARKLRKQKRDPPVIIISADAGYGKTTLCRKLTLEWCSSVEETHDDNFDLLLLIEVRKATEDGLYQYLKEILLRNFLHDVHITEKETILFLQQLNLLVIIDAYDEKSREAQKLINSLLEFLADKKIIITTRPHFMRQITEVLRDKNLQYLDLNLEGFKDSKEYIEKVWGHLQTEDKSFKMKIENFLSFRKVLPEDFKKLTNVPLINFLLIYLWINSKKPLKNLTFTSLYVQIFNLQKETIMKKIIPNVEKNSDMINEIINNFFEKLFEKCYSQLSKRKEMSSHCIKEMKPYLDEELQKHQMKSEYSVIFFSTVFATSRNLRNLDNIKTLQYEFLHKTQFEYFVACHASNLLCKTPTNVRNLKIFNENVFIDNVNEFSFLLGILNENGLLENLADSITDSLKSKITDDYDILWKLLSETMSDHSENDSVNDFKPNEKLCEYYRENLLKVCWRLLDSSVISGLRILCYADFKPEEIIIDLHDNPNNIVSFEQIFSFMIRSLNSCRGNKEIHFEIHFHSHKKKSDNINENKSSDEYLSYLKSNKILNMQKFAGCVEKIETIEILDTFKDLVRIDVRVTSIQVLKELIKACNNKKRKLKWIFIIFDEPFNKKTANELPQLYIRDLNTNICIVYNNVKDIHLVIENLIKMKPKERFFYSVELDLSTTEENPKKWLLKIHNKRLVDEKLTVRSSYEMDELEKEKLQKDLHFELRWNE